MNGPEHWAEAQLIVDNAEEQAFDRDHAWYQNAMAAAQVHATLALVAALADLRVLSSAITVDDLSIAEGESLIDRDQFSDSPQTWAGVIRSTIGDQA